MKKIIAIHLGVIFLGVFLGISAIAKADSPLTSVEFYKAYEDVAIVKIAMGSEERRRYQLLNI
jgi:hypothetical protein